MHSISEIINIDPFSLNVTEKSKLYNKAIKDLNRFHYENCKEYRAILQCLNYKSANNSFYENSPFLPVRLFKEYDLLSSLNMYP